MEMIVRGSEYQDFLNCRKKWYYNWIEKITPKRPNNKLFFGTMFHHWLEIYYNMNCEKLSADFETSTWINKQNMSGMEQVEIDDLMTLMKGVNAYYDKTYKDSDSKFEVIATELEFIIRLDGDIYYTGTIDLVYGIDGKIRFMDHKTVSSISMYVEKADMDRQISRYWWALEMLAKGIGKVKNAKGEWVEFTPLLGKTIDGFDYNLIAKDFPKQPKVLKPKKGKIFGELSQDKSQKTTYDLYVDKIRELNLDPNDYNEMLTMLKDKPDIFVNRLNVTRTDEEKQSAIYEFLYTVKDMHDVKLVLSETPQLAEQITYRNIGSNCESMCQFKAICKTAITGGNVAMTKNLAYKKNEER